MDLSGFGEDFYLARVNWLPDGSLIAQVENRAQTTLNLVRFDPKTGRSERLINENSDVWINLHHILKPLNPEKLGEGSDPRLTGALARRPLMACD